MLCDECRKNKATFHSIKKINGVSTERHLCQECHLKYNGASVKFADIDDFFSGFKSMVSLPAKRAVLKCEKCGTSSGEFLDSGYVGCPDCYSQLEQVVMPVIENIQNDTRHVGKSPVNKSGGDYLEYERLREELTLAIEKENFEQASVIRDRMRKLRGE